MGRIAGIARHARSRGPIERIDRASVSVEGGIAGDLRGARKPGGTGKRQVSLMEAGDWAAAMAETGHNLPWWHRRANLLVEDFDLPQTPGTLLAIGDTVLMELTVECDPCSRMDEIVDGLRAALTPDWRGGALARVIRGGDIAVGDAIRIVEKPPI
ncbi:MOSC domain-containing protein [Sphingomonas sp. FW199]|uniref:MOSC domain-containing protein n=1 Tax=unclassified Sphingomonas TaxID=196159 RepID=UPI0021A5A282|nr:MOSC domain-containing protein [Sphingomonas sp. BGYR3]MDG5487532.1 MOSC domain-containing protein [Sphingomonas sp. BGYR3]